MLQIQRVGTKTELREQMNGYCEHNDLLAIYNSKSYFPTSYVHTVLLSVE